MLKTRFRLNSRWTGSLASRQLFYILLFSSFVTLISASVQIYLEYRADMNQINTQMEQVKNSHLPSLTNSLWHLDDEQIQIHLNEALSIKNIVRIEIRELGEQLYMEGQSHVASQHVIRDFPIIYTDNRRSEQIGNLYVTASLENVYQRLYRRVFVILTSQAIKTFLVSLFILYIIYRLVTRHLISLADQTLAYNITDPDTQFTIDRKSTPGRYPDELDQLISAFNQMQKKLIDDMAQQQKAQRKIKKRDQMIKAVFEADQKIAFIIVDTKNNDNPLILEFSPGAEKMFGYPRDEIIGQSVRMLYAQTEPDLFEGVLKKMETDKTGFSGEVEMMRKSAHPFPTVFSVHPLFNEQNQIYAAMGIVLDITRQKELEQQFRHTQKMESIGTMAGGIAHHFNNILGIILGNTELASDDVKADHPARAFLNQIRIAGLRAKEMVTQLLNFSRQSRMEKAPIDILPVVEGSLSLLEASIPSIVKIKTDIPSTVPRIYSNPGQIQQVLINLGMNAAAAMPQGGQIIVRIETLQIEDMTIQGVPAGQYILIQMIDTGVGIDKQHLDRIFDPYFTTKEFGESTGMGLAVVHGIIHEHGGKIHITSDIGLGTRVKIYLPAYNSDHQ